MGFLTANLNYMREYQSACEDAAYDIVETIKYNLDEPAGNGCGYGLTETGWSELEETLSAYVSEPKYELMDDIAQLINPHIAGKDMDYYHINNQAYHEVCNLLVSRKLLKPNSFQGIK